MSFELTAGIVRILTSDGATAGTGFVVTDGGLIATCAHVIETTGAGPGDLVRIACHATGEEQAARVQSEWWCAPDAEDVAILRLEGSPPEGVAPLLLGSSDGTSGHPFKTFGFPAVKDVDGIWGYGNLGDPTTEAGRSLLQLTGTAEVTTGFSGAPVLDTVTRRVVGMVTTMAIPDRYGRLAETAFITPTETLRAVCPVLQISDLCPYRGLAAFTDADAEFFFGREKLVADLVDHLRGNPRFLAVVGPSGSGKSSVVQAGLFPTLRRGDVPGSTDWHLLTLRPGADPFAALSSAGLDVPQDGDLQTAIRAFLEAHPQVKRLVLFADQFEEVFVLCPEPIQARFLSQLFALLESDLCVAVILALRADFYGHLLRRQPLVDWLKAGQVNVPPMGLEELRATVEEPATKLGLRFDSGLVETIVGEAGEADHPLVLLESALTRLWEKREEGILTYAAYEAAGRVPGALSQWAEDAYSGLNPEEQSLARRVFTRLVHYSEGGAVDTRQRQSLSELVARPEERETLHGLVRQLADARLLVTGRDPDVETVEIIHDALLQEWSRLRRWVADQRGFYLWRQRLDERLEEWEEKGQNDDVLLRGVLLAEAEKWLAERPDDLNPHEQGYIQESVALREREQTVRKQLRWRIILGLAGGMLVALVLAVAAGLGWRSSVTSENSLRTQVSVRKTAQVDAENEAAARATEAALRATSQAESEVRRQEAEEQHQIAVARQLAAQAQMVLDNTGAGLVQSVLLAVESLLRHPTLQGDQSLRRGLGLLPRPVTRTEYEGAVGHEGAVVVVTFSPDGRWVASGSTDGTVRVWEAATGQQVTWMEHEDLVRVVTFSPDGRWVASGSIDGTVRVWETVTGRTLSQTKHEGMVQAVVFSPDGQWVASGGDDGTVRVWQAATGQQVARMEHEAMVHAVVFSPDGRSVASASSFQEVRVWEMAPGRGLGRMVRKWAVYGPAFSPDGQWVASYVGSMIEVWKISTGEKVAQIDTQSRVGHVIFSPDGQRVASFADYDIGVWEVATGANVTRVKHEDYLRDMAFSPDGRWLASASADGTARVWEVATGREMARMEYEGGGVAFSPDGRWVASGSTDGIVRVWEATLGQEVVRVEYETKVRFSPDGRWVRSVSWDGPVQVWEIFTGQEVFRMERKEGQPVAFSPDWRWVTSYVGTTVDAWEVPTGHEVARMEHQHVVEALVFSPDGQWMASVCEDDTVWVWEVATGRKVFWMKYEGIRTVIFSPDGQWMASVCEDDTVWVWEVATGRKMFWMKYEGIRAVTFSPDGQWGASVGAGDTVWVWEAATGRQMFRTQHKEIRTVVFSPDGRRMASASGWPSYTVRLWETATGRVVGQMQHEGVVEAIVFSPDGRWVASGGRDKVVKVWEAATGEEVARMEHHESVLAVVFSLDGQWILTRSAKWYGNVEWYGPPSGLQIWEAATGRQVAWMEHDAMVEDVTFTPGGKWVASIEQPWWGGRNTVHVWLWRPEDLIAEACARLPRNMTLEEWQVYLPDEPYRPTCSNLPVPGE